ncbi:levansucrase [Streptomyces carminius]|uniref:levansucrase n=1 Tax=Streptomyces carminius TaxID=2665496 RepID=UPI001E5D6050|nr:levansucrase [Streptomyces carminius]
MREHTWEYLAWLESRLAADGCDPRREDWAGTPVLTGRRADFRISWLATSLHLFTFAAAVPEITAPAVESFTRQALDRARKRKGGLPLGAQTGVAVFPVLVGERVEPAALRWAGRGQRARFARMARPVVADAGRRRVAFFRGRPFVGRLYASHLVEKGERWFRAPGWEWESG